MIHLVKNMRDLKDLSLQLYGKEVEITLAENSASQIFFNTNSIQGFLVARVWGDVFIDTKLKKDVIALRIRQGIREIEIPCKDIHELSEGQ